MAERETEDRRVRKTKKQLRGALTSLLLEKDISRVTVRDVADLADVNRGTFYAHYSDVYDLLHQLEDDLLRRLDDVGSRHNARQQHGRLQRAAHGRKKKKRPLGYAPLFGAGLELIYAHRHEAGEGHYGAPYYNYSAKGYLHGPSHP